MVQTFHEELNGHVSLIRAPIQAVSWIIQSIRHTGKTVGINDEGSDIFTSCTESQVHRNVLPGGCQLTADLPLPFLSHHILLRLILISKVSFIAVRWGLSWRLWLCIRSTIHCECDISGRPCGNFLKFGINLHLNSRMKRLDFGGQKSKVKVTVTSAVDLTGWWRHSSVRQQF